jgi:NH3-dependent NAD+ synthetase
MHIEDQPDTSVELPSLPREIDPEKTFGALVNWIHHELIVKREAPGFVIGLSGTDSIVAFLACAAAFKKAGKPERVVGIHYGKKQSGDDQTLVALPSEVNENTVCSTDYDPWFQNSVLPWLKQKAPEANIIVDDSINYKSDSHRWAALMDYSIIRTPSTGAVLPSGQNYWVIGTRNKTEKTLGSYSNISQLASAQPLDTLWKSEILKVCNYLSVPEIALTRARVADCVCGRFEQQAVHIEESDALLMTRLGELSPQYAVDNIPTDLRNKLESFINDQLSKTGFKEEIPYKPNDGLVQTTERDDRTLMEAKKSARLGGDTKPITAVVPELIKNGQANAACDLVCAQANDQNAWLPEAFTLFNTTGLRMSQRRTMVNHIFGETEYSIPELSRLAKLSGRIGDYGFSFPRWRYLTQKVGDDPSLVERFGMTKLTRDTDIKNARLPDPDRDFLGSGFAWHDDKWYVEFRRSYIVCSHLSDQDPATIVLRNNSYYFGRDRLDAPSYVSFDAMTPEEIKNITPETLEKSGRFIRWQDITKTTEGMPLVDKLKRAEGVLKYIDNFEENLNQWLKSNGPIQSSAGPDHLLPDDKGGLPYLIDFLEHKATQTSKPIYIGGKESHTAPWFPKSAVAVTPELISQLKAQTNEALPNTLNQLLAASPELVLLTGKDGDFPTSQGKGIKV